MKLCVGSLSTLFVKSRVRSLKHVWLSRALCPAVHTTRHRRLPDGCRLWLPTVGLLIVLNTWGIHLGYPYATYLSARVVNYEVFKDR